MATTPDDPQVPGSSGRRSRPKPPSDIIEGIDTPRSNPSEPKSKKIAEPIPSDEVIDLGNSGAGLDTSGVSIVEWASLVEGEPSGPSDSKPKFDSPSDADLIAQVADAKEPSDPAPTAAEMDDLAALLATPIVIKPASGTPPGPADAAKVGAPAPASPVDADDEAIFAEFEDEGAIDLAQPALPAEAAKLAPADKTEDSAIDLSPDAFVFEEDVPAQAPAATQEDVIDLTGAAESGIALVPEDVVEDVEESIPPTKPVAAGGPVIGATAADDESIDFLPEPVAGSASGSRVSIAGESGIALVAGDIVEEEAPEPPPAWRPRRRSDSTVDLSGAPDQGLDIHGEPMGERRGDSGSALFGGDAARRQPPGGQGGPGIDLTTADDEGIDFLAKPVRKPSESVVPGESAGDVVEEPASGRKPAAAGDSATAFTEEDEGIDLLAAPVIGSPGGANAPLPPWKPRARTDSTVELGTPEASAASGSGSNVPAPSSAGESGIALAAADVVEDVDAPAPPWRPRARTDSTVELGTPEASGQSGSGSNVPAPSSAGESGIALVAADVVEDVDAPAPPWKPRARTDSTIELGTEAPGESGSDSNVPAGAADSDMDLMAESVILEESGPPSGGSGRDLIAEGLESAAGITGSKKASTSSGEDVLEDFLATVGNEDPSSAVDLGSSHSMPVFEEPVPARDSSIRVERDSLASEDAGIDVDLVGDKPAGGTKGSAVEGVPISGIDLDMSSVVQEDESTLLHEGAAAPRPGKKARAVVEEEDEAELEEAKSGKKGGFEPKPRGRAGAWMGGTVLGAVIGAAACLGVWVAGVNPPDQLRQYAGTAEKKPAPAPGVGVGGSPAAATGTVAVTLGHIKNGDLEKIMPADLAQLDETKPEHLVARAEYYWLSYLMAERRKDPKAVFNADAEPVKKALADLDKGVVAKNAEALFLRGQIHELTGKAAEAKKDYEKGAEQFKDNAALRARFETALTILETAPKVARLAPAGMPVGLLALMLAAFQPPPGPAGAPAAPEEAGFRFWQAMKLAHESKWAEAVKALDERGRHDQRRFVVPRKQQNPLSDPREEIFLRTAAEVKAYWVLQAQLKNPDYLTAKPEDRSTLVDPLLKKGEDAARTTLLKDLTDKLAKDKPVASLEDLVKLVTDERKKNTDAIDDLNKTVDDQKKKLTDASDLLAKTTKELTATQDMLKASAAREKDLQGALASATSALQTIGDVVGVKFVDLKTSRDEVMQEVRETKRIARIIDPKGTIRRLESELVVDRAKLKQRWEPEEMLTFWLPILQGDRSRTDLGVKAELDARRVLASPSASQVQKGRALTIRGLALRNEDRYDEAKPLLQQAKTALAKTALAPRAEWLDQADEALREVSNPTASMVRRADALVARGRQSEALALLDRGIKMGAGNRAALYARRALINLESARSRGPLTARNPLVRSAQRDADEAVREGLAEGHYVAGRLAEELGQLDEAIRSYRAAVAAHRLMDAAGSRYRVALARALVKSRAGETPGVRPLPPPVRMGKAEPAAVRSLSAVELVSLLMVMNLQAPDLPLDGPKVREAERLADEILALGDKAPYDARAQALAVKGLYTRAIRVYTRGLLERGLIAPAHANALLDLVGNHPVLKRPDALAIPDPNEGEKRYAAGLNFYFGRRYSDAEKEFLSAVENDNGDARYYYFLGLARLAQGNRDGYEDFDQAARLERVGRPDRATVSKALERVQGPLRRALNEVRNRPAKDRAR